MSQTKTSMENNVPFAWYIDDNKASHVDSRVIDDLLDIIKTHFGEIKITRGNKHTFPGMNLVIVYVLRNVTLFSIDVFVCGTSVVFV